MASIDEVRARVANVGTKVTDTGGPIQQAHGDVEAAIAELQSATEGTQQADAGEAVGALLKLQELLKEAQQMVGAGTQAVEAVGARL